jgi:DGQHR domain-containing protein
MTNTSENANIRIYEAENYQDMMNHVAQASLASNVTTTAGTLYRQGHRWCFQTALNLGALASMTSARRIKSSRNITSVDQVKESTNRSLDPKHAKGIARYVAGAVNNGNPYILPSLTLNFDQPVDVFTIKGSSPTRAAVMVMPIGMQMEITDGQHRIEGVNQAIAEVQQIGMDAIGAMITFTSDIAQIHQDFADCGKTKPLAPSMLAVFDRRNPANGLALDLVASTPLFALTVDAARASISARSTAVWTTNQVRVMVKWALQGSQCSDDVFSANAMKMLGERGTDAYNNFLSGLRAALEILCRHNPTLHKLADLDQMRLDEIPRLRESDNSMTMTGSGLAVIGYLWYLLRKAKESNPDLDTDRVMHRIALVDWSHTSLLFRDNLKINPERTQSGQKYVKAAGDAIWAEVTRQEALAA